VLVEVAITMGIQIDPKNVVGRDRLIESVWTMLRRPPEEGSLRFLAERRIGKTTIITKMEAEPADGFDVLFLEVEGIDSCDRLTELLLNRLRPRMTPTETAKGWFNGLWKAIGGVEVGGVIKLPDRKVLDWRDTLEKVVEGFCSQRPDRLVLLMLDELPYMLQKINETSVSTGRPHEALTLLDTFRALRQRNRNLRMIFAGSVGLHHVLRDLRQSKLAAEPVNNMPPVEIPPLEDNDALVLAMRLLQAERIEFASDSEAIARCLIAQTSNVPFYMERIAARLGLLGRPITQQDVETTVLEQLTSDQDPWEMEHFRGRLEVYYRGTVTDANDRQIPEPRIARAILDHFATVDEPQTIDQVWSLVRGQFALTDRQPIVQMLKSLGQDHYLISDSQKRYSFRFPLVKRWWKIAQGLEA
jgi:hypothetical protein